MKSLNVTTKTADLRILGVSNFGRKATSGKQFQSTAFHPGANILQRAVQLWQINASFHTIRNWKPLLYSIIKISFSMKTLNKKTPDVHIPDTRHMSYIYSYSPDIFPWFSPGQKPMACLWGSAYGSPKLCSLYLLGASWGPAIAQGAVWRLMLPMMLHVPRWAGNVWGLNGTWYDDLNIYE